MKVSVFGMLPFSQLIKEGFERLGHEISSESPELIFANDPRGYTQAMLMKKKYRNVPLILNILDIPWHMPNIQQQTKLLINHFLIQADFITAISLKVKRDLSQFMDKKIQVIYNPTKDVYYDEKVLKDNMFLFVGRAKDPIKRFNLVRDTLLQIKDGIKKIKICGSENPGFGNYLGVISDQELNLLYNSSKYLYLPSKAEGIGLTMIEAMICGTLPIACSDNLTAKEFLPQDFICEPNAQSIVSKIEELDKDYDEKKKLALGYGKKYKIQFNKINIAKKILSVFNSG